MASGNRPLVPSFLQKADDHLLRHQPVIWQSRIHLLTWYYLVSALVIAGLCYISIGDPRQRNGLGGWVTFTILLSILGLVGWIIFLLRFNVFKRFGEWTRTDALLSFGLLFLGGFMITSLNFIPAAVQNWKTSQHYGREEIVKDINEINALSLQLEYDVVPKEWTPDTTVLGKESSLIETTDTYADTLAIEPVTYQPRRSFVDAAQLKNKLQEADSLVKISDTLYVFFTPPNYQFVSSYRVQGFTKTPVLSSAELYRKYLTSKPVINRTEMNNRLRELASKWEDPEDRNYYYGFNDTDYLNQVRRKYDLYRADDGLDHVADKRFDWAENGIIYLRVCYYVSLSLVLLLFGFRNSTARTFFISLLTILVLSILTGLMMAMGNAHSSVDLFFFLLFYYLLFVVLSVVIFSASRRSLMQGIALNIFAWATPVFPLILAVIYLHLTEKPYVEYMLSPEARLQREIFERDVYLFAEWAGPVLFLVLLQFLFSKLYRRWYALPVD